MDKTNYTIVWKSLQPCRYLRNDLLTYTYIQSIINILQNGAYMEQNTTQKVDIPHTNTDYKSNSY